MQKKILAFAGSNSSTSINKKLVAYAAGLVQSHQVTLLDINDYPLPMYSQDIERDEGAPSNVDKLVQIFAEHDGYILSLPEHNASFPAVFKNMLDWMSRVGKQFFGQKAMALLSASPGRSGGARVQAHAESVFAGFVSARVIGSVGVPLFQDNTEVDSDGTLKIVNAEIDAEVRALISSLENELSTAAAHPQS